MTAMWVLTFLLPSAYAMFRLDPTVDTKLGIIKGLKADDGDYSMFLGIPYAKVDERRPFGVAKPYPKFSTSFEAHNDSAICPQIAPNGRAVGTLDCLNLNVYVPNKATHQRDIPVLVWIHGGSFKEGHGSLYGPKYLLQHDMIFISMNYRLGVYGFMCLDTGEVSGNQGLKDQLLALKWIKENIEDFGGDPQKITVYGQSSGSASVEFHLVSQKETLFQQAILSSGSVFRKAAISKANATVPLKIAKELAFETSNVSEAIYFLEQTDAKSVVAAASNLSLEYHGCIEKQFDGVDALISESVYLDPIPKVKNMTIMVGGTSDECFLESSNKSKELYINLDPFEELINEAFETKIDSLYKILRHFYIGDEKISNDVKFDLVDFYSDINFNYPIQKSLERFLKNGANVYQYIFSYKGGRNFITSKEGRAIHSDDLMYIFDMTQAVETKKNDQLIRDRITMLWANFVKYGNPTPEVTDLLPITWPEATTDNLKYLNIDNNLTISSRPFHRRLAFWDLFYEIKKRTRHGGNL